MKIRQRHYAKAQSLSEYVMLLAILSAALIGMQVYMKRGIQAVVKDASDELGEQSKGAVDVDYKYDWKWKGISSTSTSTTGQNTTTNSQEGAVSRDTNEETRQEGILSWGLWSEKE